MDGDGLDRIFLHVPFDGNVLACWSGYGHKVRSLAVVPLLSPPASPSGENCPLM
jgi:hypothetical protein